MCFSCLHFSFRIQMGAINFHVVTKGTDAEKRFLLQERTKLNIRHYWFGTKSNLCVSAKCENKNYIFEMKNITSTSRASISNVCIELAYIFSHRWLWEFEKSTLLECFSDHLCVERCISEFYIFILLFVEHIINHFASRTIRICVRQATATAATWHCSACGIEPYCYFCKSLVSSTCTVQIAIQFNEKEKAFYAATSAFIFDRTYKDRERLIN